MFSYKCMKWFEPGFKIVIGIILFIRFLLEANGTLVEEGNIQPLTNTARNCMIAVTAIFAISFISKSLVSHKDFMKLCVVDFILSIVLASVLLSQDDFVDLADKEGFDFAIVYLLFAFAIIEVVVGYKTYKAWRKMQEQQREEESEREPENYPVVNHYSNRYVVAPVQRPAPAVIYSESTSRNIVIHKP